MDPVILAKLFEDQKVHNPNKTPRCSQIRHFYTSLTNLLLQPHVQYVMKSDEGDNYRRTLLNQAKSSLTQFKNAAENKKHSDDHRSAAKNGTYFKSSYVQCRATICSKICLYVDVLLRAGRAPLGLRFMSSYSHLLHLLSIDTAALNALRFIYEVISPEILDDAEFIKFILGVAHKEVRLHGYKQ